MDVVYKAIGTSSVWHHLVEEIVKGILLDIIPQSCLKFWRNLFLEAVVEKLAHAPVQVFLHSAQAVALVGVNLELGELTLIFLHNKEYYLLSEERARLWEGFH